MIYPKALICIVRQRKQRKHMKVVAILFLSTLVTQQHYNYMYSVNRHILQKMCTTVIYTILKTSLRKYLHRLVENRVSTCITQQKHRTSTSCWCNNGASKENLHFHDQNKQVYPSFSSWCFLKEIENMFFMFLSSCRNTCER